jgi:ABC-2 type transport system permease protein
MPNLAKTTNSAIPTILSLTWREWVRFIRQPNRVIGAVGQPILFWLLFGAGLGPSFRLPNVAESVNYGEYYFVGSVVLILLFTAIFTTISIIEDRREGFLQAVLTAPSPRWAMVLGKLLGGTLIAVAQAGLFLLLGYFSGLQFTLIGVVAAFPLLLLLGLGLTALGFVLAWQLDSTQGFHAIMSIVLLPMWLLSGSFFPAADNWVGWLVRLNPLTYGVAALRRILYWGATDDVAAKVFPATLPDFSLSLIVTVLFVFVTCFLAWWSAGRRTAGDLL